jgi:hypothetical protein
MRHVREVLRLKTAGVSGNEIARRLNVAPSIVRLTLQRLAAAGLSWALPADMTDTALEALLSITMGSKQGHCRHAEPDWAEIIGIVSFVAAGSYYEASCRSSTALFFTA